MSSKQAHLSGWWGWNCLNLEDEMCFYSSTQQDIYAEWQWQRSNLFLFFWTRSKFICLLLLPPFGQLGRICKQAESTIYVCTKKHINVSRIALNVALGISRLLNPFHRLTLKNVLFSQSQHLRDFPWEISLLPEILKYLQHWNQYFPRTTHSPCIVWGKEAYQWFARQPATISRPHLFVMRTIKRHCTRTRHRLRDCDLEIVSRNMMHLDRGGHTFSGWVIDSKRWVLCLRSSYMSWT